MCIRDSIKSVVWIAAIMWVRTTVPRLRIDQLMSFCWKILLPMALLQLLMNGFILQYEWPPIMLTLSSGAGAAALVAIIITRAIRRPKSKLVGTYKQVGVAAR